MDRELSAAEIFLLDQGLAQAGADYERLLQVMRRLAARQGRIRALCDVAAFIQQDFTPSGVMSLVLAAILRDSRDEGEPSAPP